MKEFHTEMDKLEVSTNKTSKAIKKLNKETNKLLKKVQKKIE